MKNKTNCPQDILINKAIERVFNESGRSEIPNVDLVCAITKMDRQTIIYHLQKWWSSHDFLQKNDHFLSFIPEFKRSPMQEFKSLQDFLNSLMDEFELHNELLNQLTITSYPLGNYIIQSFLDIQQKLGNLDDAINLADENQRALKVQISVQKKECRCLRRELENTYSYTQRKLAQVKGEVKTRKRQVYALRMQIKSLKKNKREPGVLRYLIQ